MFDGTLCFLIFSFCVFLLFVLLMFGIFVVSHSVLGQDSKQIIVLTFIFSLLFCVLHTSLPSVLLIHVDCIFRARLKPFSFICIYCLLTQFLLSTFVLSFFISHTSSIHFFLFFHFVNSVCNIVYNRNVHRSMHFCIPKIFHLICFSTVYVS